MMSDISNLQVGDTVLIGVTWSDAKIAAVVEAVTKTSVKVNDRLYNKKNGYPRGLGTWEVNHTYVQPYDEVIYKKWLAQKEKNKIVKLLQDTRFQNLPVEVLQEILAVLEKHRIPCNRGVIPPDKRYGTPCKL